MLDDVAISEIAGRVARAHVAGPGLERVMITPTTDSVGQDALLITMVLGSKAVSKLTGDDALDVILELRQTLAAAGEDRSPIVEYATEQELQDESADEDAA